MLAHGAYQEAIAMIPIHQVLPTYPADRFSNQHPPAVKTDGATEDQGVSMDADHPDTGHLQAETKPCAPPSP